jgi:hypothetical protein
VSGSSRVPYRTLIVAAAASLALAGVLAVTNGAGVVLIGIVLLLGVVLFVPQSGTRSRVFWWMSPTWAILIAVTPGMVLTAVLSDSFFLEHWRTPKFLTTGHVILMAGLTVTFILGAQLGPRILGSRDRLGEFVKSAPDDVRARLERATRILFWLTVIGYTLWASIGLARGLRPDAVVGIFTGGGVSQVKGLLAPVGGVTTLTQFGPVTVVCLILLRRMGTGMRTGRYLLAVFVLALVRNFVYAERLAVLEVAIPAFVIWLVLPVRPGKRRPALTLLPIWAPIALLIFFGSFEYFRSYSSEYYRDQYAGRSYADFTMTRVGAYYATGANNGVLAMRSDTRDKPIPYYTIAGLWNFPLVMAITPYERLAGTSVGRDYEQTLDARANPEFNNTGAMLLPVFDFGLTGAVAFWLVVGAAIGWAFQRFREGDVRGLLLYPVLFIGILECGLILYWPTGRALPSIVAALVLAGSLHRAHRRALRPAAPTAAMGATRLPARDPA